MRLEGPAATADRRRQWREVDPWAAWCRSWRLHRSAARPGSAGV